MAVFDKTESLVMMPLCSAFTAADKTDALDGIAERRSTITYVDGSSTIITNKHDTLNLNVRIVKSK